MSTTHKFINSTMKDTRLFPEYDYDIVLINSMGQRVQYKQITPEHVRCLLRRCIKLIEVVSY